MFDALGIRQDVTNSDHHSTRQFRSGYLSSVSGILPYKRKILDRWTSRITASGLAGDDLVAEYLHGKYIKNLSFHTNRIYINYKLIYL